MCAGEGETRSSECWWGVSGATPLAGSLQRLPSPPAPSRRPLRRAAHIAGLDAATRLGREEERHTGPPPPRLHDAVAGRGCCGCGLAPDVCRRRGPPPRPRHAPGRVERDQVGVRRAGVPSRAGGAGRGVGRTAGACGSPASGGGSKRLSPPQSGRRPCPHTQRRRAGLAPVSHLGGKNVRAQEGASLCRGRAKGVSRSDFFVPFLVVCLPHFLNTPAQPSPRDVWANKWCGAAFLVLHQEKQ